MNLCYNDKIIKFILIPIIILTTYIVIQQKAYADEQSDNKTGDFHISLQVGGGTLQTDKKLVDAGNKFASGNKHNQQKTSSYYGNAQVGFDYKFSSGLHIAPYVDYSTILEYQDASPTNMYGFGIEVSRPTVILSRLVRINYGIEGHLNYFDFMSIPKVKQDDNTPYSSSSKNDSDKNNMAGYTGSGYRLDAGISYSYYTINLFYLHNNYEFVKANTGSKEYDDIINNAFPKSVKSSMLGLTLGLTWR